MAGDRTARALARIDAAVQRIERARQAPTGGADRELEERYRDLWTQTHSALAELDRVIGALEP